jgi:hypothetical protein
VGDKLGERDIQVGFRHEKSVEPFLVGRTDDACHGDTDNAWKPADGALYLLHFYSESIYFYLMIDSAMELPLSLIVPSSKVAGRYTRVLCEAVE